MNFDVQRVVRKHRGNIRFESKPGDTCYPKEMHPVVRDEIYRIGYEAIRNSCAHAGGNRLQVTHEYARDLTLRVSDNGVGIDSEVIEKGKEGHFGLRGMRDAPSASAVNRSLK